MAEVTFLEERVGKLGIPDAAMDRGAMYAVARSFFETLETPPPEGLFELDAVEHMGRPETRARWEIRHRQIRRPEISVIHTKPPMTPAPWAELLEFLYRNILDGLEKEQPAAEWRLVGVLIRQVNQGKVTIQRGDPTRGGGVAGQMAIEKTGREWNDTNLAAMTMKVTPANKVVDEKQVAMVVDLVFADITGSPEISHPGARHGNYNPGSSPMEKYAEGRHLRYMPKSLRDERNAAKEVMARIAAEAAKAPTTARAFDRLSAAEVAALLSTLPVERVADMLGATVEEVESKAAEAPKPEPPAETARGRKP